MKLAPVFALIPILVSTVCLAQTTRHAYYAPRLENSKSGEVHDFPLGVLSTTGRLTDGDRAILVRHVGDGPGKAGGLQEGDRIVAASGKPWGPYSKQLDAGFTGPQAALATALDAGCAKQPPLVELTVLRNDKRTKLEIALPPSPRYAKSFPNDCPKADKYRNGAYQWIVDNQRANGSWPGHVAGDAVDYQGAYVGMALLSAGDRKYLPAIRKTVKFIQGSGIANIDLKNPRGGPKNWITANAAIFLSEYYLATEDESVLPDIQKCADLLAKRVSGNGRMGHRFEVTYGGGGLTIINAHAHVAWALAEKCGCKIDNAAWNRSQAEILKAMTKSGAVGYSSSARGDNDAPARTGGAAVGLSIRGQQLGAARKMGRWLIAYNNRMRHAHANCCMGLFFGTAGIKHGQKSQLNLHLNNWLSYLELSRNAHGSASYFGSKRNFGGDSYLGFAPLANATVALMLASPEDNLFVFGGRAKGWLNYRTWRTLDGKYEIVAKFVRLADGQATLLRKEDGKTVKVPLDKLSPVDQAFVRGAR